MARSRLAATAFCLLATLALPALADGGDGNSLGSLKGIGSTQDFNRPTSGRIGGIAVDPSDPSGARHFNGVPNRISQGNSADAKPPGDPVFVGSGSGVVWGTTKGGGSTSNPGVGFLRSTDGGRTGSAPAGGSGALLNNAGNNTWSKPATPAGPTALRAKTN